jgi:cytoskeletal protein RodZ
VSGEAGEQNTNNNNNDPEEQQQQQPIIQDNESDAVAEQEQDFSEPLSPEEAIITDEPIVTEDEATTEPEPEPAPMPQLPARPAETPSTSNNALIMQIKILSKYAKDIRRSMYAVSRAAGVHLAYPDDLACQMTGRPVGWLVVSGH